MQLTYLLAYQEKLDGCFSVDHRPVSGTIPYPNLGIGMEHSSRLWEAFENAAYVDFHERLWPNSVLLPRLKLNRAKGSHNNPDAETSYILPTWIESEFRNYCADRKVGFAGAEVRLLEEVLGNSAFQEISRPFGRKERRVFCTKFVTTVGISTAI
jgi:hypothetical protein